MLPFLEVPMCIQNSENEEKVVLAKIQPSEIAYHYPGFNWGVVCVMKSGSSFLVNMPPDDFDYMLDAYETAVKKNAGKFGTIRLTPKPKIHAAN